METQPAQSERVQKSASFMVHAPLAEAFPLFEPIREKEWAHGWEPHVLYGASEAEQHMIFQTSSADGVYTWAITQFDVQQHRVEYTVSTPERIWFITVQCEAMNAETKVDVTYTYTGLTARGNVLNKAALEKMFAHNLKDWEEAINHYLTTGKQLKP